MSAGKGPQPRAVNGEKFRACPLWDNIGPDKREPVEMCPCCAGTGKQPLPHLVASDIECCGLCQGTGKQNTQPSDPEAQP